MITELFNPKVCFAKELRSSWSKNIKTTSTSSNKIPISNVGQEICLHFEHTGDDSEWLLGLLPLKKLWDGEDLSGVDFLTFCYYSEGAKSCNVCLSDINGVDSSKINVTKRTPVADAICEIKIPVQAFLDSSKKITESKSSKKKAPTTTVFDVKQVKFLKFTGANGDNFYISRIRFENA